MDHPHITPVYDAGETPSFLYIVMRYIDGPDLRNFLAKHGQLGFELTSSIMRQVSSALDEAHDAGLVHRDVKPANILMTNEDGEPHCYLCDFGLTKRASSFPSLTQVGQFVGTVDYTAPEQIEGKVLDHRADVYSLGCVLYECLTKVPPFKREAEVAVLWAHLQETARPIRRYRPDVPAEVEEVLARALAKAPEDRFSSCGELSAAFARAVRPINGPARSDSTITRSSPVLVPENASPQDMGVPVLGASERSQGSGPRRDDDGDGLRSTGRPRRRGGDHSTGTALAGTSQRRGGGGGASPQPHRRKWLVTAALIALAAVLTGGLLLTRTRHREKGTRVTTRTQPGPVAARGRHDGSVPTTRSDAAVTDDDLSKRYPPNATDRAIIARIPGLWKRSCHHYEGLQLAGLETAVDCAAGGFGGAKRAVYLKFESLAPMQDFLMGEGAVGDKHLLPECNFAEVRRTFPGWRSKGYVNCFENANAMPMDESAGGHGSAGTKHDPREISREIDESPSILIATTEEGNIVTFAAGHQQDAQKLYRWWVRQGHVEPA